MEFRFYSFMLNKICTCQARISGFGKYYEKTNKNKPSAVGSDLATGGETEEEQGWRRKRRQAQGEEGSRTFRPDPHSLPHVLAAGFRGYNPL